MYYSLLCPCANVYMWDVGGMLSGATHFINFSQVNKYIFHAPVIISFISAF